MKKLLLVMAAAFAMVACQTDINEVGVVADGVATVEFEVGAPQMRSYSLGQLATNLKYAVYDEDGNILRELTVTDATINGSTKVSLELAKNKSYSIIFWAEANNAPYTVDFDNKTVAVNYNGAVCNDESRDAFYAYLPFEVTGAATLSVELRRPFAQVNVGTSDLAAAQNSGFDPKSSSLKVKNVFSTLNLVDGTATDNVAEVEFATADIPVATEAFPVANHAYMAMSYVLVGKDKGSYDVTYTINAADGTVITNTIGAVPMQANYRTNIYGKLLTSTTDINVEINPDYNLPNNATEAWDGQTIKEPTYDEATKTYSISCASELAYIAQLVNGTLDADNVSRAAVAANSLKGCTVKLENNIALNGMEWTPIGNGNKHFMGTFDGNHKTISGLKVTKRGDARAALFGTVSGTVVFRNLTISEAEVRCPDFNGDFYGSALIGTAYGVVTIENVDVVDSYLSGNNKVGALIAHDGVMNTLTVSGCDVSGTTFEATDAADCGSVGGLLGYFQTGGEHHITNCSVKGCTFNVANSTNSGKRANGLLIGGIDSKAGQKLYINGAVIENNTWNEKFYVDGVEVTEGKFVSPYGGLIGGERNDKAEGELYINDELYVLTNYVYTAEQLAEVVSGATEDITVTFANDLHGAITLNKNSNPDVDVLILGNNKTFAGKIHIWGAGGATSTMTIKGVNFVVDGSYTGDEACIYTLGNINGTNSYARNVTIDGCTFSGTGETVAAIRHDVGGTNDWTIKNCTVNAGMHSFLQIANVNSGLVVDNCKAYSKNGVNLNQTHGATFTGCEFDVKGYAVRVGVNQTDTYSNEQYTFSNCHLKSQCNDGDAVVVVRGTAQDATLTFVDCDVEGTTTICGFTSETTINGIELPQLNNQIWYTATALVHAHWYKDKFGEGTDLVSNVWDETTGKGVITLSGDVTKIGSNAFYYDGFHDSRENLISISLPNTVTEIGEAAFDHCPNLTTVTFNNNLVTIGPGAFIGCAKLTNVILPESLTTIGNSAFNSCTSLKSITIPAGVTSIGSFAFNGISDIKVYCKPTTPPTVGSTPFNQWWAEIYVPTASLAAYQQAWGSVVDNIYDGNF